MSYTKGRWRVEKYSGSKWGLAITTNEHQVAGILPKISASDLLEKGEHKANASLIAAAPDLLEAAKAVLQCPFPTNKSEMAKNGIYVGMFEIHGNRLDLLKQAVDKAESSFEE